MTGCVEGEDAAAQRAAQRARTRGRRSSRSSNGLRCGFLVDNAEQIHRSEPGRGMRPGVRPVAVAGAASGVVFHHHRHHSSINGRLRRWSTSRRSPTSILPSRKETASPPSGQPSGRGTRGQVAVMASRMFRFSASTHAAGLLASGHRGPWRCTRQGVGEGRDPRGAASTPGSRRIDVVVSVTSGDAAGDWTGCTRSKRIKEDARARRRAGGAVQFAHQPGQPQEGSPGGATGRRSPKPRTERDGASW